MSDRVLVLLIQSMYDIVKVTPLMESNAVLAIKKYGGTCDDILVVAKREIYDNTVDALNGYVKPSNIIKTADFPYSSSQIMVIAARKMINEGLSSKTAICMRPSLIDMGAASYGVCENIYTYIENMVKTSERHDCITMATATDDYICRQTRYVSSVGSVKVKWVEEGELNFSIEEMADYPNVELGMNCEAGIYSWRPYAYLAAVRKMHEAKGLHYHTMMDLVSYLANTGRPIMTPCVLRDWRPIVEYCWPPKQFFF